MFCICYGFIWFGINTGRSRIDKLLSEEVQAKKQTFSIFINSFYCAHNTIAYPTLSIFEKHYFQVPQIFYFLSEKINLNQS